MNNERQPASRERRWLLLGEEGSHSWLGRATDPDEDDIDQAEASLRREGIGGWIAVSEGDYWSRERFVLLEVRPLNQPSTSFANAAAFFLARRREAVDAAS